MRILASLLTEYSIASLIQVVVPQPFSSIRSPYHQAKTELDD